MVIWKFPLVPLNTQQILIPDQATILSVLEQNSEIVLYAIVDLEKPLKGREVAIVGTGHTMPEWAWRDNFLGTIKLYDGQLMFHVFVRPE